MKITIKHYGRTYSIALDADDITFEEYMEAIKDLSKAIYHPDTINEYWEE